MRSVNVSTRLAECQLGGSTYNFLASTDTLEEVREAIEWVFALGKEAERSGLGRVATAPQLTSNLRAGVDSLGEAEGSSIDPRL